MCRKREYVKCPGKFFSKKSPRKGFLTIAREKERERLSTVISGSGDGR